jgi:DNA topoisomerase-1
LAKYGHSSAEQTQIAAEDAGLRYVNDAEPGIRRRRSRRGFAYRDAEGRAVTDHATVARIRNLAIPPAYDDVWICADPRGHIQATGRDARGRKQYRYHPAWRAVRDSTKYERLAQFGAALRVIRARARRDMARPGLGREKVLAAIVRLLDGTLARIGNESYRRENNSFGITTLRNQHVDVDGATIRLHFKGKSGRTWKVRLTDRRVARVVRSCQDLPGQDLFQYVDDEGTVHKLGSNEVNDYLRALSGHDFTAKDFRTWAGTVLAAFVLRDMPGAGSQTARKANLRHAIEQVADRLGNTPTICRKCYIHPAVLAAYDEGALEPLLADPPPDRYLAPAEVAVLRLLKRRVRRPSPAPTAARGSAVSPAARSRAPAARARPRSPARTARPRESHPPPPPPSSRAG